MRLITRQTLANIAADRWHRQYIREPRSNLYPRPDDITKHTALVALGPNPNPDDVDAILGNNSWTSPGECGECKCAALALVEVGEAVDYESRTAYLCLSCLTEAVELFPKACPKCDGYGYCTYTVQASEEGITHPGTNKLVTASVVKTYTYPCECNAHASLPSSPPPAPHW